MLSKLSSWKQEKSKITSMFSDVSFVIWGVFSLLIILFLFSTIIIVNHHVIFYFPFHFFNIGLILLLISGAILYIRYIGVEYFRYSWKSQFVLYIFPLLAVLAGFLFSFLVPLHTYKDQGDGSLFLASKFDKEVLEQTFSPIKLSNRDVENPSKPYLPNKKIYIVYKLGCPYCRAGITKVLSQLKDQQKEKVAFIDLSDPNNAQSAKKLGVTQAAMLITFDNQNRKSIMRLADGDESQPIVDEVALSLIEKFTKE